MNFNLRKKIDTLAASSITKSGCASVAFAVATVGLLCVGNTGICACNSNAPERQMIVKANLCNIFINLNEAVKVLSGYPQWYCFFLPVPLRHWCRLPLP